MSAMTAVTAALGGRLAYGGDYNPEQWPEEVREQDVALMQEAHVNLVSVGIFSWALLEPEPGRYEFEWLDRVLDRLHRGGIAIDLASGTASPPPWFLQRHPEAGLVDAQGVRRGFGSRQAYCPSAPAYRDAAARLAGEVAKRYADHPGVVMWHLNNEYGCHNWHCFCDSSAAAFRHWLRGQYADPAALNEAWGTAFWSQRYTDWDQVDPPREVSYNSFANPTQQLDWWRFSSDELRGCLQAEIDAVTAVSDKPVTTNFMGFFKPVDYRAWVRDLDPERYLVSNDHYLIGEDPGRTHQLAMTADLLRSLAGQRPWLLMEHSTSAVNWQPRNIAKTPGEMRRNSLQHVARGADGALFFQWRASAAGAEKFHSAMVPHAGTQSRLWRDVVQLGADLEALADVAGTRTAPAPVALVFDWPSWWAAELDSHPSVDVDPLASARRWHELCWARNVGVDVVGVDDELAAYPLVVVPAQYLLTDSAAARLDAYARGGGTLVVTYFSGIVDEHDRVRLGGYPGALRETLGVRVEEFHPLAAGGAVALTALDAGTIWSEMGEASDAEVVASYAGGAAAGSPAVTRRRVGQGTAWYVGTELSDSGLAELGARLLEEAGVRPTVEDLPAGVEAVRRVGESGSFLFVINHTDAAAPLTVPAADLLTGRTVERVAAGGVAVLREES
jgi:beta-galactosidase